MIRQKTVEIELQSESVFVYVGNETVCWGLKVIIGGEGGIRTRGGLLTLTRFPGVRLKPLIHLSCDCHCSSQVGGYTLRFSTTEVGNPNGAVNEISLSHRHH